MPRVGKPSQRWQLCHSIGRRTKRFSSFFKIDLTPQLKLDSTTESLALNHIPNCGVQAEIGDKITGALKAQKSQSDIVVHTYNPSTWSIWKAEAGT